MKKSFLFFFSFIIIFCFSQESKNITDTITYEQGYEPTKYELKRCKKQQNRNEKKFKNLLFESKKIDFSKLTFTIIKDLHNYDFKGNVILFYFRYGNTECSNYESEKFICENEYNSINPFYNIENWTIKDVVLLSKVLNEKIIVPSEKKFGLSISNNLFKNCIDYNLNDFPEFKIGKVYDKEVNIESNFYYLFDNDSTKNLFLKTDYLYNTVTNYSFDTLYFKFKNLLGNKVEVTRFINNKSNSKKIYEYHNKEWRLIQSD